MNNKTKKILACACLGLVGMGCLAGCDTQQEYNQDFYELTVINDSLYGIISPVPDNETNSVTVDSGDNYTFTITPKEEYKIDNLIIDGELVEPQTIYTFKNIENDHSIGATYSKIITNRKIKSLKVVGIEFDAKYEVTPIEDVVNGEKIKFGITQSDSYDLYTTGAAKDIITFDNNAAVAGIYPGSNEYPTINGGYGLASGVITYHKDIEFSMDGKYRDLELSINVAAISLTINLDELNSEGYYHDGVYSLPVHMSQDGLNIYAESGNQIKIYNLMLICEANYYL